MRATIRFIEKPAYDLLETARKQKISIEISKVKSDSNYFVAKVLLLVRP